MSMLPANIDTNLDILMIIAKRTFTGENKSVMQYIVNACDHS